MISACLPSSDPRAAHHARTVRNGLVLLLLLVPWTACTDTGSVSPEAQRPAAFAMDAGAIVRGDTSRAEIALVFTGDSFAEGMESIRRDLAATSTPASFFFTGNFYRNPDFAEGILGLRADGHYLGAHSDRHLLYCTWEDRDSLLVTREEFERDLLDNYAEMARFGIARDEARFYLPPYEWYNETIAAWTREMGLQLVNFTPGTRSNADYTTPDLGERYVDSQTIYRSILDYEEHDTAGMNGFILLVHVGAGPDRTDKFYDRLAPLLAELKDRGYTFVRIDRLLAEAGQPGAPAASEQG